MSEYNQDLKIDFAQLDINWRDHSANYMKWSEKWVNAVSERDRAKEAVDVLKAELNIKYRKKLDDGKKPTEGAITAAVLSDNVYKEQQQNLLDTNERVNLLATTKTAFEHRKKALEGLTQLWLGGYFSNPNIPSEIKEQFKEGDVNDQRAVLNKNSRLIKRKAIKKDS